MQSLSIILFYLRGNLFAVKILQDPTFSKALSTSCKDYHSCPIKKSDATPGN